jgi:hypothetical protein
MYHEWQLSGPGIGLSFQFPLAAFAQVFGRSFTLTIESSSGVAGGLAGKENRKQSEEGKDAVHMEALWLNESKDFTPYFLTTEAQRTQRRHRDFKYLYSFENDCSLLVTVCLSYD